MDKKKRVSFLGILSAIISYDRGFGLNERASALGVSKKERSPELVAQLKEKAQAKRNRKNLKRMCNEIQSNHFNPIWLAKNP